MSIFGYVDPASSGSANIANLVLGSASRSIREVEARAIGDLIGRSFPMQQLSEQIALVAPTNATVLILGESGTGKELVSREIHKASSRCNGPMVRVNCAAVPRELFESEFFGHVK